MRTSDGPESGRLVSQDGKLRDDRHPGGAASTPAQDASCHRITQLGASIVHFGPYRTWKGTAVEHVGQRSSPAAGRRARPWQELQHAYTPPDRCSRPWHRPTTPSAGGRGAHFAVPRLRAQAAVGARQELKMEIAMVSRAIESLASPVRVWRCRLPARLPTCLPRACCRHPQPRSSSLEVACTRPSTKVRACNFFCAHSAGLPLLACAPCSTHQALNPGSTPPYLTTPVQWKCCFLCRPS